MIPRQPTFSENCESFSTEVHVDDLKKAIRISIGFVETAMAVEAAEGLTFSKEEIKELMDEATEEGIRHLVFCGVKVNRSRVQ